ncbi:fungal specific transcription factor domain-containing protein [Trichoderma breve]|uniref:Fungal specific transcription factor domain-containing protein n=1 Tax=Trichoderma breve TaxID=2034170 RepID=A0A9W9B6A5_9HYPO|nr:fungal specific transcription factor domain-containing protein [Trichoderma breve]KAJ4856772.1 fungal specific transcription factor domain-containing protein [Trichoderma breve]
MSLAENDRRNLSDLQFHGPSSSEYGLNIAQNSSGIDEMTTVTEELNNNDSWGGGDVFHEPLDAPCTVPVHRLLSKADTFRLLHVYQEVIGNFYPILNLQSLGEEAEKPHDCGGIDLGLRRGNSSHVDSDSILVLNLVCSIALTAETTGRSKIAQVFYESAQSAIQTNVTARKLQIRDVVLVLLASIYHYFSDDIRLAWRLCGIAGRMVMELGIHRREIFHQLFNIPSQRDKVGSTIWTIVVLDRQWSCALGIPQNFQESDFDKRLPVPECAIYLKAMLSYGLLSPVHWDRVQRKIAGAICSDEDSFRFLTSEVEQWRGSSLNGMKFIHPIIQDDPNISWKTRSVIPTLLHLRANQLQHLLFQQLLISNPNLAISTSFAEPSLETANDTIEILCDINESSDLYRKQLPVFRHFLASSISVILMTITHKTQIETTSSSDVRQQFLSNKTSDIITRAVQLATAYADSSGISRQLWEQLVSIVESLWQHKIITNGRLDQITSASSIIDFNVVANGIPGYYSQIPNNS